MQRLVLVALAVAIPGRVSGGGPIVVDADFPAGNIVVENIQGDTVRPRRDERDTPRFWSYWYFRVRGAENRTLTFQFTRCRPDHDGS